MPMSKVDGSWIWLDVYRSITPFRCGGCVSSLPGTSTPCQCVTLTSSDSLPAPVWLKHSYGLTPGGSLSTCHSLAPALLDPHQGVGLTPGGALSLPGTVWLRHSSILTRVLASLQVALSLYLAQSGSGTPRSSPGCWSHSRWLSLSTWHSLAPALLLTRVLASLQVALSLYLAQSGSGTPRSSPGCWSHSRWLSLSTWHSLVPALLDPHQGVGLTPGGSLSLPGTVWLRHSSSPGCWPHALRVALSLPSIHLRQFLYPFPCT